MFSRIAGVTTLGVDKKMEASDEKESPEFGVPLLCHVSRADQLKLANFLEMLKRLPCGLVAGKSLMLVAIVVQNVF